MGPESVQRIDVVSGGDPARDGRMDKSILESDRYPIISFRPTRVIGEVVLSGDEVVTVEGAFRIHGAEHPLQLPIHIHPEGNAITLKSLFTVPYVDWGIKDPSIFVLRVDKTVDIEIEATRVRTNNCASLRRQEWSDKSADQVVDRC